MFQAKQTNRQIGTEYLHTERLHLTGGGDAAPLTGSVHQEDRRLSGTSELWDLHQGDLFHMESADETRMFAA